MDRNEKYWIKNTRERFMSNSVSHTIRELKLLVRVLVFSRAGNNFSSLTGHVSFQIFILVGHLINLTGH